MMNIKIDLTRLDIRSKIILDTRNVATERPKKKIFFEKKISLYIFKNKLESQSIQKKY